MTLIKLFSGMIQRTIVDTLILIKGAAMNSGFFEQIKPEQLTQ